MNKIQSKGIRKEKITMIDEVLNMLVENPESSASLDSFLSPEVNAEIFLLAMEETCTPDEFYNIVIEGAVELEAFGIIPRAEMISEVYDVEEIRTSSITNESFAPATEAQKKYAKKVVVKQDKDTIRDRIEKRACIRLGKENNDPNFKGYAKARKAMIAYREALYKRWLPEARKAAKVSMTATSAKASTMGNARGASIVDKMDQQIEKINSHKS